MKPILALALATICGGAPAMAAPQIPATTRASCERLSVTEIYQLLPSRLFPLRPSRNDLLNEPGTIVDRKYNYISIHDGNFQVSVFGAGQSNIVAVSRRIGDFNCELTFYKLSGGKLKDVTKSVSPVGPKLKMYNLAELPRRGTTITINYSAPDKGGRDYLLLWKKGRFVRQNLSNNQR